MEAADAFAQLLAKPEEQIDLARAALLIARDAYASVDTESYLRKIDEIAKPVRSREAASSDPREKIKALSDHLHIGLGFRGNREDYYDPRNSYLNEVLDRRLGIPISLSLVYIEVAKRAGLTLNGVGLPGRFLVGYRDSAAEVFLDPFDGGRIIEEAQCRALVAEVYGASVEFRTEMLAPVTKRQMLFRMLNNLKLVYMARQEPEAALPVVDKMLMIDSESWIDYRDRGLIRYGLGRHEGARADLRRYLRAMPDAPDRPAVEDTLAAIETILAMLR